MPVVFAVPFQRPSSDDIRVEPWLVLGDDPKPLPDALLDWDYNIELSLGRSIFLNGQKIRSDSGLLSHQRVVAAALWSSPGSFQRGVLATVEVTPDPFEAAYVLRGTLHGRDVAGILRIETVLLLGTEEPEARPLIASRAGTILWREAVDVRVEGTAARFPVEAIQFSEASWAPTEAGWLLAWNPFDLHQPFLGAVRLFVNAGHERVVRAVAGAAVDEESAAIRSAIYFDVGRALVRGALASDEFLAHPDTYNSGTIGSVVAGLIASVFPGEALRGLRGMMEERSDYFDSLLQAKLQLFRY